jgi:predicted RNA-binding Zn-ribbon protein involved in translation (DUF1610 family)
MSSGPFCAAAAALRTFKAATVVLKRQRQAVKLAERRHCAAQATARRAEAAAGAARVFAGLLPAWMQATKPCASEELDCEHATAVLQARTEDLLRARCAVAAAEAAAVAAKRALQAADAAFTVTSIMAHFDDTETGRDVAMVRAMCAVRRARRLRRRTETGTAEDTEPRPYWTAKVAEVAASSFVPTREAVVQVPRNEGSFDFRDTWFTVREYNGFGPHDVIIHAQAVAAIDPGVRTFLTVYCPTRRRVIEVGLPCDLDMLRHAAAKGPHVLQEFVGSLHRVVANWLVRTFVAVYVPALGGEEQSRRCRLRLGAHVAQDMDMWGHTEFLRLLQATAADSSVKKPCVVHVVDEAYTTRTCTLCGVVASYMGGATVFSCAACGLQLPRDWNGARGIWLRSFAR